MSHFFSYYYETANFFMNPLLYLYHPLWQFLVRGTLLSSDVFLINAVFCGHNIAGINGSKLSFTESLVAFTDQRCRLQIHLFNYLSAMLSTNPRCSLQIRGLIYQSAGVKYWSAEKIKCSKQTQNRSQAKNMFFLVHLGTMT